MYKSNIEICLVITNEIASEIKEIIISGILGAGYKLNQHQTIEEFLAYYKELHLEVCMITNESDQSESYKALKEQYRDLKDVLLVESEDDNQGLAEHTIYIDSEYGEISIESLLAVIDSTVDQLEIEMYGGVPREAYANSMEDLDLPIADTQTIEEDEIILPPSPDGEKEGQEVIKPKESEDGVGPSNEQKVYGPTGPKKEELNEPGIENKEPNAVSAPKTEVKPSLQNNSHPTRFRDIQKSLSGHKMDKHKTIGVWSPLHMSGVTSLLINFSLFLSENKVHTAVLESLTSDYILKDWLKRYSAIPENWVSLASNLHSNEPMGNSEWIYRGVKFFPLNKGDVKQNWNVDTFRAYHRMTEIYDVTLIDMPTGEMEVVTEESLKYMDELWIIVDDRVQQFNSWKDYIKTIKETHNIPAYLIHNKILDESKPQVLSEVMEVPMLATIPPFWKETAINYYQRKPLYLQKKVQPILQAHYHLLATHLIGPSFQLQVKKPTLWEQIAQKGKFQNILNG